MTKEEKKIKSRERVKAWREANPERALAAIAKSKAAKPEKYKALQRSHYLKNKTERNATSRLWHEKNKERSRELVLKWIEKNPERRRQIANDWRKRNPEGCKGAYAKRRAAKKMAVPKWANEFFISEAYALARLRTKVTGYKWHVDHIVPLTSPVVCGLHVEHNLQVIPAKINQSKNNRHWPDMP